MKPNPTMTTKIGINLFRLTTRIKESFEAILRGTNDDTGEISEEAAELVGQLELQNEAEALDAACAVRELEEVEAAFDRQIKRLAVRKAIVTKQQEYLRGLIQKVVAPGTKLADERVSISWRASTQTAVPEDLDVLPGKYLRIKKEADRVAIKKALGEGKVLEGCALVSVNNLQIN